MNILKEIRHELGICVDCGEPITAITKPNQLRCEKCETVYWAHKRFEDKKRAEQEAQRKRDQHEKCITCEWGTYTGSSIYCPWVSGTCAKDTGKAPHMETSETTDDEKEETEDETKQELQ